MIAENLKYVDLIAEVIDARVPISSRNPNIDELSENKPRIIILNRADQADPAQNRAWSAWFNREGWTVLETNAKEGKGVGRFPNVVRVALKDQIEHWKEKGQIGRTVRVMIVGIPNVGKSTFINQVARRKSAKAGDRPGVTRGKQWVSIDTGLDLLDTPGILWPKFEDPLIGLNLAFIGAIKDEVMDMETLASRFMEVLAAHYPAALEARYQITPGTDEPGWSLLERTARRRSFLISGGEPDLERMANVLMDEYRSGRLGRFTLEHPEDLEQRDKV